MTEDCMMDARKENQVRTWLDVGDTEDSMADAMYKEQGCGWRKEKRGLYDERNV